MGAQFAHPDKLVFAICGDGGFQMSIPELATIAGHGLPVKMVISNNGYLGMVRQWQELFYNNRTCAVELESFPMPLCWGRLTGSRAAPLNGPEDLRPRARGRPSASSDRSCSTSRYRLTKTSYPMVPAGAAINEMVLTAANPWRAGIGGRPMIQVISLLVENKPGALMRITGVIGARGYNIESLTSRARWTPRSRG